METISVLMQPVTLLVLALYAYLLFKSKLDGKVLRRSALVILLAGIALYMYGYSVEGYNEGIITLFLRSLVASVRMFVYSENTFELLVAQKHPLFLDLFFLVFYAAILTSISAIIMLFGKRAMTLSILLFKKKKFEHVFLGLNKRSQMIASGIKNHEVAFIEFPSDSTQEEASIQNAIKHFSEDSNSNGRELEKHFTILTAKHDLKDRESSRNVFSHIGLKHLKHLIDKNTTFYLLSEDSNKNLNDLMVLLSDPDLEQNTIHVCVKREGIAQSYQSILGKTKTHFIYPSSLAAVELMKNPICHPSSLMQIDRDADGCSEGTVSGEFNALVVGFGETGQAAVKFIYEFASAIRKDGSRLPVKIYVNDESLDGIKGHFSFSCPDMNQGGSLVFEPYGSNSGEFWDALLKRIDNLNYIEISMGDDAANLELACTILIYAMKKRRNGLENFRILVRKRYSPEYEVNLINKVNEKAGREVMVSFGEYKKIFTSDMIVSKSASGINRTATSLADDMQHRFEAIAGRDGNADQPSSEQTVQSFHDKRRRRRETHQFISRANFAPSMSLFAGDTAELSHQKLESLAMCEHLRFSRYLLAHGYSYDCEDDDVLKTNHQICEWNALSEEDKQYHRDMVRAMLS